MNPNQLSKPSSEDVQMLYNELTKLDRTIAAKSDQLDELVKEKFARKSDFKRNARKPKRYSIEIEFPAGSLVPRTRSFIVEKGTIFRPKSIDYAVRSTFFADPGDPPSSLVTITTTFGDPFNVTRNAFFASMLAIRDSGSDREWQNFPFPDAWLLSGLVSPFYIFSRNVLAQGTEVFFEISPFQSATGVGFAQIGTVLLHTIQVGMSGFEEYV